MTGVGAPYEQPTEPDLVLCSHTESVEEEVDRVIELLLERGLIGAAAPSELAGARLGLRRRGASTVVAPAGLQGLVAQRRRRRGSGRCG